MPACPFHTTFKRWQIFGVFFLYNLFRCVKIDCMMGVGILIISRFYEIIPLWRQNYICVLKDMLNIFLSRYPFPFIFAIFIPGKIPPVLG